jgi:Uma2 family endonuclease
MNMDNTAKNKIYTYIDYKNYPENEHVELIDGHIYAMVPAPSRIHQKIIVELSTIINNYIKANNGECEVYVSPFDVILLNEFDTDADNSKDTVQPDIAVICDKNKLTDQGCIGTPDFILEIVSPYNPSNDYIRKLSLYSHFKVREYWIINPLNETIFIYKLEDNEYTAPMSYSFKDIIKVGIFNNLFIDFNSINLI